MTPRINLFAGNANPLLAQKIAENLHSTLGEALITQFSDGETRVQILENVRGQDVFIIQPTSDPVNTHLMEIFLMADALRRASAFRVTAVIPYFGYARQDKRIDASRVPIAAKLAADLLACAGIDRVIAIDLHTEQMQGFFSMAVENVFASKIFLDDIHQKQYSDCIVVSPDIGGVIRARAFAERLNIPDLAVINKRRSHPNESSVMNIIGDVENKTCIIVDDIVDTGGTLSLAATALKDKGARKVVAYCSHPVLSGQAIRSIEASALDELVVTDTIPLSDAAKHCDRIRQLSVAHMLAEVIRRVSNEESISKMFK